MDPINTKEITQVMNDMKGFKQPWFIAGGWSIDLAIGAKTRDHLDMDIVIFREHTQEALDYFKNWEIKVAIPGEARLDDCSSIESTFLPRYCLHLFRENDFLEILLTERAEGKVIFRKDRSISMEVNKFSRNNSGYPYIAPEWQLLFKGINPRPHDEMDFQKSN